MQSFIQIPITEELDDSLPLLLNNTKTALSQSSGSSFPDDDADFIGRPCYRTDQKKLYVCTSISPSVVWTLMFDFNIGKGYAALNHNHDSDYAAKDHSHNDYAPTDHSHSEYLSSNGVTSTYHSGNGGRGKVVSRDSSGRTTLEGLYYRYSGAYASKDDVSYVLGVKSKDADQSMVKPLSIADLKEALNIPSMTVSTDSPSGGKDGDIWFQVGA